MAFLDFLSGAPAKTTQIPLLSPTQINTQNQLLSRGLAGLDNVQNNNQNQFNFDPIAQRARTEFTTKTLPSIAERFTAAGGQRSSAYGGANIGAGLDLQERLAALEAQYNHQREGYDIQRQGQQSNLLQNLLQMGLGRQFESIYEPEKPGFLEQGGQAALKALPLLLDLYFGGGSGTLASALASLASKLGSGGNDNFNLNLPEYKPRGLFEGVPSIGSNMRRF